MNQELSLLDKASKACGSYYKLAEASGIAESTFSRIRSGERRLPVVHVLTLSKIAKVNPQVWLWRILQERIKSKSQA